MASTGGRITRVAAGTALIGEGLAQGRKAWLLAVAGLLPQSMCAFDWYLLSHLQELPFEGPQLREVL